MHLCLTSKQGQGCTLGPLTDSLCVEEVLSVQNVAHKKSGTAKKKSVIMISHWHMTWSCGCRFENRLTFKKL